MQVLPRAMHATPAHTKEAVQVDAKLWAHLRRALDTAVQRFEETKAKFSELQGQACDGDQTLYDFIEAWPPSDFYLTESDIMAMDTADARREISSIVCPAFHNLQEVKATLEQPLKEIDDAKRLAAMSASKTQEPMCTTVIFSIQRIFEKVESAMLSFNLHPGSKPFNASDLSRKLLSVEDRSSRRLLLSRTIAESFDPTIKWFSDFCTCIARCQEGLDEVFKILAR